MGSSIPLPMFKEAFFRHGRSKADLDFLLGNNFGYVENDRRLSCIFAVKPSGKSVVLNAWQPSFFDEGNALLPELNDPNFAEWVLSRCRSGEMLLGKPAPEVPYITALGDNLAKAETYFVSWPEQGSNFLLITSPGGRNPQLPWYFFGEVPYWRIGTSRDDNKKAYRMCLADLELLMADEGVGLTSLAKVLRGELPSRLVVAKF